MKQFSLFVNGKDIDTGKYEYFPYSDQTILDFKKTYQVINKLKKGEMSKDVDKYIYAKYCVGDNELNKKAIDAAYEAAKKYRKFNVLKRKKILYSISDKLVKYKSEVLKILTIEGHTKKLAEWEYNGLQKVFCKESIDLYKDELWTELGCEKNERIYLARKPDGVVVIIPPKNAPACNSLIGAYALLSGNAIIVKPPLKIPVATIFVWKKIVGEALKENGAPDGIINIVMGNSKVMLDEWLKNPKVNDIFFSGGSAQGLEIGRQVCEYNKKPILELSGNDNLFVWDDCDLEKATDSAIDCFLGSTQICMIPKTLIVHENICDKFVDKMLKKVKSMKYGLPSSAETFLTPVVKINECIKSFADAKENNGKVLCGGNRVDYNGNIDNNGVYFQPTLVLFESDNPNLLKIKCVCEENFFPVIPIIKVLSKSTDKQQKDKEIFTKMMEIADSNEYGLRASVWVKSAFYTRQFMQSIDRSGLLRINSKHIGVSTYLSSHGGIGKTGGPYGEMNYIWLKTSHMQGISLTRE
jgi:acyl-CoA reductase-like NAD-dependent aldehyde dehydrogenase